MKPRGPFGTFLINAGVGALSNALAFGLGFPFAISFVTHRPFLDEVLPAAGFLTACIAGAALAFGLIAAFDMRAMSRTIPVVDVSSFRSQLTVVLARWRYRPGGGSGPTIIFRRRGFWPHIIVALTASEAKVFGPAEFVTRLPTQFDQEPGAR
jgi:hypothetical protein